MRKFELMTTFHRMGYEMYGKNMIESVLKYWPKDINFTIYLEEVLPEIGFTIEHVYSPIRCIHTLQGTTFRKSFITKVATTRSQDTI